MNTQTERIALSYEVMREVKNKIISSNCIIPKVELPFVDPTEHKLNIQRFGKTVYDSYMAYQVSVNSIRKSIMSIASKMFEQYTSIWAFAITEFGVGECHENASLACVELMKKQQKNISMVLISSPVHAKTKLDYHHVFVLFGPVNHEHLKFQDLNVLSELPEDVIVIDPFLNCVVPAYQYIESQKQYLEIYKFNKISQIDAIPEMSPLELFQQDNIVKKIASIGRGSGLSFFKKPEVHPDSLPFQLDMLEPIEDTLIAICLKTQCQLAFQFGHFNYHVHAFAKIDSIEDAEKASQVQRSLHSGYFYKEHQQNFFVLNRINTANKQSDMIFKLFGC
jgi:hypothetical protein